MNTFHDTAGCGLLFGLFIVGLILIVSWFIPENGAPPGNRLRRVSPSVKTQHIDVCP